VKWAEAQELHRPAPQHHRPGHPPPPPQFDPIAAIPPHELVNTDVGLFKNRILGFQIASQKTTWILTIEDQSISERLLIVILR